MSNYNEKILIVEDDPQIRKFINYSLDSEGFRCFSASDGASAKRLLISESIDLMLLDLGLPDVDGMDILREVREFSQMPIIVVSARDQDKEKVAALDLGADDYLTKPFSAVELLARIRVAIRHLYKQGSERTTMVFQVGTLKIDYTKHLVYLDGLELHMTPMEYNLLALLGKNAGKVMTTGSILKELWGANYGSDTQALRALMASMRRKIEKVPAKPRYILTEIGVGYRLVDE
ncbi:MAG: response regulator transcription factor [Erysipelotrichaceae bacterium]